MRLSTIPILISVITLTVIMASCGDDDDDDSGADSIVGSWRLETFSLTECANSPDLIDFQCGNCISHEFKSDGTFDSRITIPAELDSAISGTYTLNGNTLTACDQSGNCDDSTIELSGDNLVIIAELLDCQSSQTFERN